MTLIVRGLQVGVRHVGGTVGPVVVLSVGVGVSVSGVCCVRRWSWRFDLLLVLGSWGLGASREGLNWDYWGACQ